MARKENHDKKLFWAQRVGGAQESPESDPRADHRAAGLPNRRTQEARGRGPHDGQEPGGDFPAGSGDRPVKPVYWVLIAWAALVSLVMRLYVIPVVIKFMETVPAK